MGIQSVKKYPSSFVPDLYGRDFSQEMSWTETEKADRM